MQSALQNAFEMAAAYVGKEAPNVQLDRDFDLQTLDGNQVGQYLQLWSNGAITQETLLGALKKGEILPDVDVEEEVELTSQEKLDNMLTEMVPGEAAAPADDEGRERRDPNIRQAAVDRMRGVAERRAEEDEE